jgi:hypothetical protein
MQTALPTITASSFSEGDAFKKSDDDQNMEDTLD